MCYDMSVTVLFVSLHFQSLFVPAVSLLPMAASRGGAVNQVHHHYTHLFQIPKNEPFYLSQFTCKLQLAREPVLPRCPLFLLSSSGYLLPTDTCSRSRRFLALKETSCSGLLGSKLHLLIESATESTEVDEVAVSGVRKYLNLADFKRVEWWSLQD